MRRRDALKVMALGLAASTAGVGGCARRTFEVAPLPSGPRRRFGRVHVAPERVIRTVAGLRPYRPSGFVVRLERLGEKLLIHNYGHGGGGVTLSWGTSQLAVEHLDGTGIAGSAAVLGCGVVGLSTALLLQRRGWTVSIYARDLPPHTTSNMSGATWFPSLVVEEARRTPAFDAQFERAARLAHRAFQDLVDERYGVRWREQYFPTDQLVDDAWEYRLLRDLFPEPVLLGPGEHPFPMRYAWRDHSMYIEPPVYLRALLQDFHLAGGRVVIREFRTLAEVAALPEPVAFNCTGLGARELVGDPELTPVKGQLTVLLPQPEVDYGVSWDEYYMNPRRDGIILGGTHEHGVESLDPDPAAARRILDAHQGLFDAMR